MNMTKSNFKNKVKDWFIIQRIRLTNFAKEHKYISAFIGIFLMSSIVALIVFATDGDPYEHVSVSEGTATPTSISGSDKIDTTKTFSTIVYNIAYRLSSDDDTVAMDEVVIEARLPKRP